MDVDIAEHDEYTQWGLIANDEVDACLEVWPSGHTVDIKNYIDTGKVELGGFLGPVGKIGWYLPTYVMDEHPELASWEGLLEPGNADLFKVNPADAKGRFVGGDATWVEYDDQIIANLNLPLKLEYVGSEEAILSELDTAYASNKPILFYFWTPHWALQKYNLSTMALKEYSDECYAKASSGGVDCDYPEDRLLKILSPVLKGRSKQAYSFFKSMTLTNQDQIQMMAKIEIDGMTDVAAAQWWIGENQSKWGSWIVP